MKTIPYNDNYSEEVFSLHVRGLKCVNSYIGSKEARDKLDSDMKDIDEHYLKGSGIFLLMIDDDNSLIAMGGIKNEGNGKGTLKRLRVEPEIQGRGLGSQMLSELLDWARHHNFKSINTDFVSSSSLADFYIKNGFSHKESIHRQLAETEWDEDVYTINL